MSMTDKYIEYIDTYFYRQKAIKCLENAEAAREETEKFGIGTISRLSIQDRFSLTHYIKEGLYTAFPTPEGNPFEEIDETKVPNEISALSLLNSSLTLSDDYQDFVLMVTKQAADELSTNTQYIDKLLEWRKLTKYARLGLCQNFHNVTISFAQQAFRGMKIYDSLAQATTPTSVSGFSQTINTLAGYASIAPKKENDKTTIVCDGIALNVGTQTFIEDAVETIDTIAHETAHIIEGLFAFMHSHHSPFVPEVFRQDAKLLYNMHALDAYVGVRIVSVYNAQASEKLATQAGTVAKEIIGEAITKTESLKPSLPFIRPRLIATRPALL